MDTNRWQLCALRLRPLKLYILNLNLKQFSLSLSPYPNLTATPFNSEALSRKRFRVSLVRILFVGA